MTIFYGVMEVQLLANAKLIAIVFFNFESNITVYTAYQHATSFNTPCLRNDLYCVGWDVKPYSTQLIQHSAKNQAFFYT